MKLKWKYITIAIFLNTCFLYMKLFDFLNVSWLSRKKVEAKTTFYRNHYIRKSKSSDDTWGCKLGGSFIEGTLGNIERCIDYWFENRVIVPPSYFDALPNRSVDRQVSVYKGIKLINDSGAEGGWYVAYRGKLLKGTKAKLEKVIDLALVRQNAKRDEMVKRSIHMSKSFQVNKKQRPTDSKQAQALSR